MAGASYFQKGNTDTIVKTALSTILPLKEKGMHTHLGFAIILVIVMAVPFAIKICTCSVNENDFYFSKPSRVKHRKKTKSSRSESMQTTE